MERAILEAEAVTRDMMDGSGEVQLVMKGTHKIECKQP